MRSFHPLGAALCGLAFVLTAGWCGFGLYLVTRLLQTGRHEPLSSNLQKLGIAAASFAFAGLLLWSLRSRLP